MFNDRNLVKCKGVKSSFTPDQFEWVTDKAERLSTHKATLVRDSALNFLELMEMYPGESPDVVRDKIERTLMSYDMMIVNEQNKNNSRQSA